MLHSFILLSLLFVGHVAAATDLKFTSVSFQLNGWLNSNVNTATTFYGERVLVSLLLEGWNTTWYNATDWINLYNYQRTNVTVASPNNEKILKIKYYAANTGNIVISGSTQSRWARINDNRFFFNGNLTLINPWSYISTLTMKSDGEYIMDLASIYNNGLPVPISQPGLSEANCYDNTKQYICFKLKSAYGGTDSQEKVDVRIEYKDGYADYYYQHIMPPKDYYTLIMLDAARNPQNTANLNRILNQVYIVFTNDDVLSTWTLDRKVFLDVNSIYFFGAKANLSELIIGGVGVTNPSAEQLANYYTGQFVSGAWYYLNFFPNGCSTSGSRPKSSHRMCLRLKSSSAISTSTVSLTYTNSLAPSTPITQTLTLNSTTLSIPIDVTSGNINNVKVSVDPTQTPYLIDMGATMLNGSFVTANDLCMINNGTLITSLLNFDIS